MTAPLWEQRQRFELAMDDTKINHGETRKAIAAPTVAL
jgi:hypothetical protein